MLDAQAAKRQIANSLRQAIENAETEIDKKDLEPLFLEELFLGQNWGNERGSDFDSSCRLPRSYRHY